MSAIYNPICFSLNNIHCCQPLDFTAYSDSPALPLPTPCGASLNTHKPRNSTSLGNWHTRATEDFLCIRTVTLSREWIFLTGKSWLKLLKVWERSYGSQGCNIIDPPSLSVASSESLPPWGWFKEKGSSSQAVHIQDLP